MEIHCKCIMKEKVLHGFSHITDGMCPHCLKCLVSNNTDSKLFSSSKGLCVVVIVLFRTVGVKADLQSGWCVSGRSLVGLWFRIARLSIYEKKKNN